MPRSEPSSSQSSPRAASGLTRISRKISSHTSARASRLRSLPMCCRVSAFVAASDSTRRRALAFGIMCLGCFMAYLDTQIVSASIQEIGGGLSASSDELSWIQSSYLIAEIIVIPLSAWLSRVMSTRWLIAASAAGFTLTSLLCGSASDMRAMIVFRALQGFLGGSMIPTAFTAAVVLFQGKQKAIAASFVSAAAGLAPTLGPVVGGWLTDSGSWHWLFD